MMEKKTWFSILLLVVLVVSIGPKRAIMAQKELPESIAIEEGRTINPPVMGYQGRLLIGGSPVNGNRSMTFKLYHHESGGSTIWTETKNVFTKDGLFQTILGESTLFSPEIIEKMNHNLWLEVTVDGTILPRQPLMGTPYAFSLVPGAVVEGTTGPVFRAINQGSNTGLYGGSVSGTGVIGESIGENSTAAGVSRMSSAGSGVAGYSESGSGVYAGSNANATHDEPAALVAHAYASEGIAFEARSESTETTIVAKNLGSGPIFTGLGGTDEDVDFMVENDGSVKQALNANGLVKVGLLFNCSGTDESTTIIRSFNTVGGDIIVSRVDDDMPGLCSIHFDFDLSNRFWIAQDPHSSWLDPVFVTCSQLDNNTLQCTRFNLGGTYGGGIQVSTGPIMLLVY